MKHVLEIQEAGLVCIKTTKLQMMKCLYSEGLAFEYVTQVCLKEQDPFQEKKQQHNFC